MPNYGINDVSKHVNIASKCVNITFVQVVLFKYHIARASYEATRGSRHAVIFVFFIAKIALNSSVK